MGEKKLVEKLLQGDKRVLRRFYKKMQPELLRWVLLRVRDREDAEEIVHDVFLSFFDSLPLFRSECSLWTFMVSIGKHEVADYWRKRYAKKAILTIPFADQVYTEKLYSSAQTAMVIKRVFSRMMPHEVKILQLKYEDGMSVKQIARQLGVSVKAAESKLFRARKAFQTAYESVDNK